MVVRITAHIEIPVGGGWGSAGGCTSITIPYTDRLLSARLVMTEGLEPPPGGTTKVTVDGVVVGTGTSIDADVTAFAIDGVLKICVEKTAPLPMYWVGPFTARGQLVLEYSQLTEEEIHDVVTTLTKKKEIGLEDVLKWTLVAVAIGGASYGVAQLIKAVRRR